MGNLIYYRTICGGEVFKTVISGGLVAGQGNFTLNLLIRRHKAYIIILSDGDVSDDHSLPAAEGADNPGSTRKYSLN